MLLESTLSAAQSKASLAKRVFLSAMFFALVALSATHANTARADVIYGTSVGNIVSYNTDTQVSATIPTNLNSQSYGIAYGPDNNLYIVERDSASTQRIEVYSTSGTDLGPFAFSLPYNGLSAGLTFDSAGNLYAGISDSGAGTIEEFFAGGGSTTLPGNFSFPGQLAVDASNNLLVSDIGTNNVWEYGPSRTSPTLFAHQNNGVGGVAADSAGNVYITTNSPFDVYRYGPGGGTPTGNPFSNVGGSALVYSPGAHAIFGVSAPNLYQYDLSNNNPATNLAAVSSIFAGTAYLTVAPVPEPSTIVLFSFGALGLASSILARRRRA